MKTGSALWFALALFLGALPCRALTAADPAPLPPPPAITADDQFLVEHPDLKDEAEVVDEACKTLASEGYAAGNAKEVSEAIAAKSRAILAERTPEQWQQKAVDLYPALGEANSEFNLLFRKHYQELKASSPAFIQEPSWPVLLAKRCDDELRAGPPAAIQSVPAPPPAAAAPAPHPADGKQAHQTRRSTNFWQTFVGLLLVIALSVAPGAFIFRKAQALQPPPSEQTPASKSEPTIWRAALKHAAIIYVVVALPASFYSLMANSDLGFIDRLFVSFLVGSLFGLFITLPLYGFDTLWQACQKHPARPATR